MAPSGLVLPTNNAAKPLRCIPEDVCLWGIGPGTRVGGSCPGRGSVRSRPKWQCFCIQPLSLVDATVAFGRRDTGHTTNCIRYWKKNVFIHPIIFMRDPGTGGSNASGTGAHIRMRGKLYESGCNTLMMLPNCTINNQYTHINNQFTENRMQGLFVHFIRELQIRIADILGGSWPGDRGQPKDAPPTSSHPAAPDE